MSTQNTKYLFAWAIRKKSWGLKNEFELAMVNEQPGFELLRFDYIEAACRTWPKNDNKYFPNEVITMPDSIYQLQR